MSPVDLSSKLCFSTVESGERMLPREHIDRYPRSIRKHQKSTATGRGRAWSEEEEKYLIENRFRKVPYRVIAAYLHKTDLACRLHYHQLGSPNGRQERTLSISSSTVSSQSPRSTHLQSTSVIRRNSSPDISPDSPGRVRSTSVETFSTTASPPHPHVTTLFEPVSPPNQRRNALRLDTSDVSAYQQHVTPKIDEFRLRQAYDTVSPRFWGLVAAEYGSDVAPATLEKAWCNMTSTITGTDLLPTPCVSPQSATGQPSVHEYASRGPNQFHAINDVSTIDPVTIATEKSSFAISSLLTQEN